MWSMYLHIKCINNNKQAKNVCAHIINSLHLLKPDKDTKYLQSIYNIDIILFT